MNQIIEGGPLIDIMEVFISLKDCLAVGIEVRGHREDGIDMLSADVIPEATTLAIKHDIDATIILNEMRELVAQLLFVAVLTGRQVEGENLLSGNQVNRRP